ncbi:hypothetical protein CAP48_13305 [Advenella sp. S44]|nr:hypothetical protein CAP48_13305 [Advenella sp. S44]
MLLPPHGCIRQRLSLASLPFIGSYVFAPSNPVAAVRTTDTANKKAMTVLCHGFLLQLPKCLDSRQVQGSPKAAALKATSGRNNGSGLCGRV